MDNMKASIPTRQSVTTMLMDFENGSMNIDQTLELFSILIQTGLAWRLQGSYGRMARHLIDQGSLSEDGTITHEFLPF
tara:strand:+ start:581 stop:814 length:234 start_codon:yes stop_codon:yes gene_type:complete